MMMTHKASHTRLALREIFVIACDTFRHDKVRFSLTTLGVLIGTASLILVTTIGLAGKDYLHRQIQSIGANLIYAEHDGMGGPFNLTDALNVDDMEAVRHGVSGIVAASPVLLPVIERVAMRGGKVHSLQVMGVYPEYEQVRELVVL